ncbi:collagen-like protein [Wolbachia endosymbiont of Bemisia tabaci]|uniref:collagen-like protein n=1 Tax=Wolbachia endosymbiont of Bemisia tabaci TaxID=215173 RepID=UPI000D55D88D|nr:collagen-like protein [Wolbachia endosymbiont of Bemisia tabaci]
MRFNLEPGGAFCDGKNKLVTVKINDEEKINLPYTSYIFDKHHHFIISNFKMNPTNSILTNFYQQKLYLKLEKVESDYKLVLVNNEDQYYYYVYYNDTNIVKIATFNSIPSNFIKYQGQDYILSYDGECSVNFVPLINSRVLVDPKDIMSNQDIDFVLKELEKLPDKRLRIGVGKNFLRGPEEVLSSTYKSAEVYGIRGNKIGILNNIATSFSNKKLELFSGNVSIDTIDQFGANLSLKKTNPRFRIKRLNNDNYVGCMLSKYGKCERFYALTPESFEQGEYAYTDYDDEEEEFDQQSHYLYAYYYYLHDLEVTVNNKKLEQRIEDLERIVKSLNNSIALVPGLKGEPGERGMRGLPGSYGQKGEPGELVWDSRPGEKGERGFPGPKGEHGIMGYPGNKGEPGPIGSPGIPGLDGIPGKPGTPGQKGNKGDTPNAQEIATELVTSKKAELVEAVLNTKGIIGKNLATQIADKINIHSQEFVNKIDVAKLTEGVVSKLSLEEAKNIIKDTVSKITSDATKKNNPDPIAFQKYEKFAEKLAKLLVDRSSMSEIEAHNLIKGKVSDWALAKYLLLHSDLNKQPKALEIVKQEIDKEKLIEYLLEYAKLKGDVNAAKTIVENIVHQFFDTQKVGEIGKAVLEAKNDQDKKVLVNDPVLREGIAEELRQNPGKIKGPKGDTGSKGDTGTDGLSGAQGPKGEKGEIGSKGDKGEPGANGLQGTKGEIGVQGPKGQVGRSGLKGMPGPKGDTGAPGANGLPGSKGEDGIGATLADQFLREIRKAKNETLDAKKAAEAAQNASEGFAKQAKDTEDKVKILHNQTVNLTGEAEDSADQALQSAENAEALHSSVRDMFCTTNPADQVCSARRRRREIKKSSVTSGASRPTSFISQVINFFYPAVGQDEYKVKNEIQEVAKIIDAADIVTKFEEVLGATAVKCGISKKSLNFYPVELQSTIINKSLLNDENHNELLKFLCVTAKKSLPNYKQTSKCLFTFKDHMEKRLKDNEQQRALVNTEKIVADNEQPRSFMTYVAPPSSLSAINQQVVGYLR